MKNADMPAIPIELNGFGQYAPEVHMCLTKREMLSMHLMSAYRTQHETMEAEPSQVAEWAVEDADALLAELDK